MFVVVCCGGVCLAVCGLGLRVMSVLYDCCLDLDWLILLVWVVGLDVSGLLVEVCCELRELVFGFIVMAWILILVGCVFICLGLFGLLCLRFVLYVLLIDLFICCVYLWWLLWCVGLGVFGWVCLLFDEFV